MNHEIALLGPVVGGLGGSVFTSLWFKRECGQPEDTDLAMLLRMLKFAERLRKTKHSYSIHDVTDGGLITAVMEMAFHSPFSEIGVALQMPAGADLDQFLFGETIPRVVMAFETEYRTEIETIANQAGVSFTVIGETNDEANLKILQGGLVATERPLGPIRTAWENRWKPCFE